MDLSSSRAASANIERFIYRELGNAETEAEIQGARDLLRLAVGLRRKLETYHCVAASPASHKEE
jgi:hypothetical protein